MAGGTFAVTQGSTLPFKYTDESLIPVPVRKEPLIMDGKPRKRGLFSRLKGKNEGNEGFTIKQIQRGEYLKHYAKDDNGWYSGTEQPAEDCILKDEDPVKATVAQDIASLGGSTLAQQSDSVIYGKESDDGVIR